jgi:hypothetical protein
MKTIPKKTKNKATTVKSLAELDLFLLLGMADASDERKLELAQELEELVLSEFLTETLPQHFTHQELEELAQQLDGKPKDHLFHQLEQRVPNIEQQLYDKHLSFKKEFVLEQLSVRRESYSAKRELADDNKQQRYYSKQHDLLDQLISSLEDQDWTTAEQIARRIHSISTGKQAA